MIVNFYCKKIFYFYFLFLIISSCEKSGDEEYSGDEGSPVSISSSASENATIAFGQTFQHQVTTTGTYSGPFTYSLWGQPEGMTISSSGMIEWTPNKASHIKTHTNIKISLFTVTRYEFFQNFDITVTGTCTSGNVLAIWIGDQRTSIDSSKFLANITAYTDNVPDNCGRNNNLDCTAENNYEYNQTNTNSSTTTQTCTNTSTHTNTTYKIRHTRCNTNTHTTTKHNIQYTKY